MSSTNAASQERRLLRYAGSNRPGECAKKTSTTVPGASGHHVCTARSASARSAARSPNRLNASAGDQRRSAHSRWWSKLWCGSATDVRARAASSAPEVRKFAPVSRAYSSGSRLPTGRAALPLRFGTIGCEPIGCPRASRHCAWWYRNRRRNSVICGRPGTWSSASQQYAASSCFFMTSIPGSYDRRTNGLLSVVPAKGTLLVGGGDYRPAASHSCVPRALLRARRCRGARGVLRGIRVQVAQPVVG